MIERLRILAPARRHPRSEAFSRYLEDDLDARERGAIESHIRDCPRCREELASLSRTLGALRALEPDTRPGLADSIIAALRTENRPELASSARDADIPGSPQLAVVPGSAQIPRAKRGRWPQEARAALRWCLQSRQLRLTVPIALTAGVVLSMVNMGGMLMHGRIDFGVCVSCTVDFLVPFLALNLALLMLLRLPARSRR